LKDLVGDVAQHRAPLIESASEETQDAMARIFEAQEETTRRIAQNLHDEASQMLALVYLELAKIARNSSASTAQHIERVIGHLDSVCEQMRGLSHELHPMALERHGLLPALKQLADGVSRRSGLDIDVHGEIDCLPKSTELGLYRVVQEALSNVVRHADANRAEVRLWKTGNGVHCSVKDDGVGFQLAKREPGARYDLGLGLVGIFERVDSLGGECHILSGDRKGMELTVGIPL
jgi:signal transduction histidine kinase